MNAPSKALAIDAPTSDAAEGGLDTSTDAGGEKPASIVCPAKRIEGTGRGLKGEYFVGQDLTNLALTRYDASIDFDWGSRGPEVALPREHFSVRWTGQIEPSSTGTYTFTTNTDDGARLWVDQRPIVDNWTAEGASMASGAIDLVAGQKYDIKMEYYQSTLDALAELSWSSDCQPSEIVPSSQLYFAEPACATPMVGNGTGLKGDYFASRDLTNFQVSRIDPDVSFDWADGTSPDATLQPTVYSARWTGQVQAETTEAVTFYTVSDDGVRLFVDDVLVIDNWYNHGATEDAGTVNLVAGRKYNLRLEFYNNGSGATIHLSWGSGCLPKQPIPTTQLYPTYTGVVCAAPSLGTGSGLRGNYFAGQDLSNLATSRIDTSVSFDWLDGMAPADGVPPTQYSVRWTGQVEAKITEATTFDTISVGGVRLFVDDMPIIDNWTDHERTEDTGVVNLVAGQRYNLRLEFYESRGSATIYLSWAGACLPPETIPIAQLYPPEDSGADSGASDTGKD